MITAGDIIALSLIILLALCFVPALLAGLYTGDRLVSHLIHKAFTTAAYIVLVIMVFITLYKGAKALFGF